MTNWHYVEAGVSRGPISEAELASMLARGHLSRATPVWNSTLPNWVPASSVPAFAPPGGASGEAGVPPIPPRSGREMVESLSGRIGDLAGTDRVRVEHLGGLFSEVFRRHDDAGLEAVFATGVASTTPRLAEIDASHPTPWVFSRVLVFFGIAFLGLWLGLVEYGDKTDVFIPNIVLLGSFAFPVATAIFFFECNVARNIPLFTMVKLFVWGGIIALIFSMFGYGGTGRLEVVVGAAVAGVVEEPSKLAAVLLLASAARFRWTLNGMALGAAVGAGFAAFESAGYAFHYLLASREVGVMLSVIVQRGLLAPFAHVVWTAIAAGALWRVRQGRPFEWSMLSDRRFAAPIIAVMILHAAWDTPLPDMLPFRLGYLILGAAAWVIAIGLLLGGLREIRDAQASGAAG